MSSPIAAPSTSRKRLRRPSNSSTEDDGQPLPPSSLPPSSPPALPLEQPSESESERGAEPETEDEGIVEDEGGVENGRLVEGLGSEDEGEGE
jgi:hypothetical protein